MSFEKKEIRILDKNNDKKNWQIESCSMFLNEWCNCENDSNDVKVVTRSSTNKVNPNREPRKHFDRKGNLALISCGKPNLYGLPRGSFCSGGGGGITPCLKLVIIMLETWNLLRKYTQKCSFRKYNFS